LTSEQTKSTLKGKERSSQSKQTRSTLVLVS
jgi:hypothetical protein